MQQQLEQCAGGLVSGLAAREFPPECDNLPGVIGHRPFPSTPFAGDRYIKHKINYEVQGEFSLALGQKADLYRTHKADEDCAQNAYGIDGIHHQVWNVRCGQLIWVNVSFFG
jgi:hypothetical protein